MSDTSCPTDPALTDPVLTDPALMGLVLDNHPSCILLSSNATAQNKIHSASRRSLSRRSSCPPKKRAHTTLKQKMMIINFIKNHPSWDQATVAKHFQQNGFPTLSQSTISRYIKDEERYRCLALDPSKWEVKKQKQAQSPQILTCMEFWFYQTLGRGNDPYLHRNLDLMRKKWKEFELLLAMCYKKRSTVLHNYDGFKEIPKRFQHPNEFRRIITIDSVAERDRLQQITDRYQLEDILAMDEIGLAYSCPPSEPASLCSLPKLTLALTCSADGSWKDTPLIIGQTPMSVAYPPDQLSDNCGFSYFWNTKAVMTCAIWEKYLISLDQKSRQRGRKVLLLVDVNHVHLLPDPPLANVQIEFVDTAKMFGYNSSTPPCHPFAAGMTKYFKSEYRVRFCLRALSSDEFGLLDLYNLDQAAATRIIQDAWNCMTPSAITSTFRRSGVIPNHLPPELDDQFKESVDEDDSPIEDPAVEQSIASLTMCLTQLTIKVMNLSEQNGTENREKTPITIELDPNINPELAAQSVQFISTGIGKSSDGCKKGKKPEEQIVNAYEFIDIDSSLPTEVLWDEQDIVDQVLRESKEALIHMTSSISTPIETIALDLNRSDEATRPSKKQRSMSAVTETGDIMVTGDEVQSVRRQRHSEEYEEIQARSRHSASNNMFEQPMIRSSSSSSTSNHNHSNGNHHHNNTNYNHQDHQNCNELSNFSQQINNLESVRKFCLDFIAKNRMVNDSHADNNNNDDDEGGRMLLTDGGSRLRSSIIHNCLPVLLELEDEFKALEAADLLRLVSG